MASCRASAYGESIHPYIIDDVKCLGMERSLFECSYLSSPSCGKGIEEASVECSGRCISCTRNMIIIISHLHCVDITLDSIQIRLTGDSMLRGLVEVYYGNEWGYVCADHWTVVEAGVVCRQLGFEGI